LDPTTIETQLVPFRGGSVETATIVKDRDTNGPRGFAFVEMTNASEAKAAIESLNGFRLNDRAMILNAARPIRSLPGLALLHRENRSEARN
jgi:RNA recognition motif-containing protein